MIGFFHDKFLSSMIFSSHFKFFFQHQQISWRNKEVFNWIKTYTRKKSKILYLIVTHNTHKKKVKIWLSSPHIFSLFVCEHINPFCWHSISLSHMFRTFLSNMCTNGIFCVHFWLTLRNRKKDGCGSHRMNAFLLRLKDDCCCSLLCCCCC